MHRAYRKVRDNYGELSEELMAQLPWVAKKDCRISQFVDNPAASRITVKPNEQMPITIETDAEHYTPYNYRENGFNLQKDK